MSEKTRWPGIYDLGGGKYRIRVYDPRTRSYIQERITGLREAQKRQAKLKSEVQQVDGRRRGPAPTVKEFAESWRTELIHAPGSARDLEVDLRLHIYPHLGAFAVDQVSHRHALGFIRRLTQSDLALATQGKIEGHVRALFRAVVADGWRERSPFDKVARIELSKRAVRRTGEYVPTLAEALQIAELVREDGRSRRFDSENAGRLYLWAFVRLLVGTGLRIGEMCGLAVEELDYPQPRRIDLTQQLQYGDQSYFLAPPKSEAGLRQVPLAPWIADTLAILTAAVDPVEVTLPWIERGAVRRQEKTTLLFSSRITHGPLSEAAVSRPVREAAVRAGLPGRVTPHSLRRTYTTVLHDASVPLKVIDALTGHESDGITLSVYTEVTDSGREQARTAVQRAYERALQTSQDEPADTRSDMRIAGADG